MTKKVKELTEIQKKALKTRITLDFPIALGKTVFVLRGTDDQVLDNGIILPESSDTIKMRGTVMAVGPDVTAQFIDHEGIIRPLRPMDKVLFNSYANLSVNHKSNSYVLMSEIDIYAVLPEGVVLANDKPKSRKGVKTNWEG